MFCLFTTLIVIQLCLLIINLINPTILQKPITAKSIAIAAGMFTIFLSGGFQEYVQGTDRYGTPEHWVQVAFWAIVILSIATSPERKKS
jgi:hypothetical protein